MEISRDRFGLALERLTPGDWQRFEHVASTFLASEWDKVRTLASYSGDGGRDAELFTPLEFPHVVIQFSIAKDWQAKIRLTFRRLKEGFPSIKILVFMSSQTIGASSDGLKRDLGKEGVFLDVRDKSWFLERLNLDANRIAAAQELARHTVDPLLESKKIIKKSNAPLSADEAKTALFFLEMHWHDETSGKGLTKSSFEALVRGALSGTSNENRMTRAQIYDRICSFLPQHAPDKLAPYIDAAITRISKSAIKHHRHQDEFHLSFSEGERLKDMAASVHVLQSNFEGEINSVIDRIGIENHESKHAIVVSINKIVEKFFFMRGGEFADSLAKDVDVPINDMDLRSVVADNIVSEEIYKGKSNVEIILAIISNLLSNPSVLTKNYLQLLSDCYTLFAFLERTPDVQKATKKLFSHGQVWLDTSVILPIFSEQAFPDGLRPFTTMFERAQASSVELVVSKGVLEEVERHLNLCITYTRTSNWRGRVPYVYSQYIISGRSPTAFGSWLEQFCGQYRPEEDIAEYLSTQFAIKVESVQEPQGLSTEIVSTVREYWKSVHSRRRHDDVDFSIAANRLAEHDAENCLAVFQKRKNDIGQSPLGYSSWWLTMDSAAYKMRSEIDKDIWAEVRHSPVISIDFLLKYIAFGPRRDRHINSERGQSLLFAGDILKTIPKDLLDTAQKVREEYSNMPERVIHRKIRDALDRERMKLGPVQRAGLQGANDAINDLF